MSWWRRELLLGVMALWGSLRSLGAQGAGATAPPVTGIVARVNAQGVPTVSWDAFPKAVKYFVVRWSTSDASCCKGMSPPTIGSTTLSWQDGALPKAGIYGFRVYATTAAGTYAGQVQVTYQPGIASSSDATSGPQLIGATATGTTLTSGTDLVNRTTSREISGGSSTTSTTAAADPTEFSAAQGGEGEVVLSWKDAPGVTKYLISGPGAGNGMTAPSNAETYFSIQTGLTTGKSSYTLKGVPVGTQTWTIASVYDPGGVRTSSDSWPKATATVTVRSGRYRVTLFAFAVNTQTTEGIALDGRGDEVYLAAHVATRDMAAQTWGPQGTVRSVVFGDVFGTSGRQLAGTASADGGLRSGDVFPVGGGNAPPAAPKTDILPMLLWEGRLIDDVDLVLIAPSIWESDNSDVNFSGWSNQVAGAIQNSALGWSTLIQEIDAATLNAVRGGGATNTISTTGPVVDHPIGMISTIQYSQQYLPITRRKIEAVLSSSTQIGGLAPGVIAVAVSDQGTSAGITNFGGSYTMYLRVERLP